MRPNARGGLGNPICEGDQITMPTIPNPVRDARDYLATHDRDVSWLPPSQIGEVTELRRQLANGIRRRSAR